MKQLYFYNHIELTAMRAILQDFMCFVAVVIVVVDVSVTLLGEETLKRRPFYRICFWTRSLVFF